MYSVRLWCLKNYVRYTNISVNVFEGRKRKWKLSVVPIAIRLSGFAYLFGRVKWRWNGGWLLVCTWEEMQRNVWIVNLNWISYFQINLLSKWRTLTIYQTQQLHCRTLSPETKQPPSLIIFSTLQSSLQYSSFMSAQHAEFSYRHRNNGN